MKRLINQMQTYKETRKNDIKESHKMRPKSNFTHTLGKTTKKTQCARTVLSDKLAEF